jgi:hypothetical protein
MDAKNTFLTVSWDTAGACCRTAALHARLKAKQSGENN